MKGEACSGHGMGMGIQKRGSFYSILFPSLFEVSPIAQQVTRDLMGVGFRKAGKGTRKNEKRNLWHGQSYNPDSRD